MKLEKYSASKNKPPVVMGGFASRFASSDKAKSPIKAAKKLWQYLSTQKKSVVFLLLLVIVESAVNIASPFMIGRVIDNVQIGGEKYLTIVAILALMYLLSSLSLFMQGLTVAGISMKVAKVLRKSMFDKLTNLDIDFYDGTAHGDVMSRFTNDIDNVSSGISQSLSQLISGAFTVAGTLVFMLILDYRLCFVTLVSVPLTFTLTKWISRRTRPLFRKQSDYLGMLNAIIEESVDGLEAIQINNKQNGYMEEFSAINEKLYESGRDAQIIAGFLMPMMNVINNLGFAAIAFTGGYMAFKGLVSPGIIASFVAYSRQFVRPINEIASIYSNLQSSLASGERIVEMLEIPDTDRYVGREELGNNSSRHLEFRNVDFSYIDGIKVLEGISFKVPPGSRIALVGPTGAGKTTIANLLSRFYDTDSGDIRIDGTEIKDLEINSLRKEFGIVLQDTYLFSGSILDNIRYGRLDATDDQVYEAARVCDVDRMIERLPDKYMTMLTPGGMNISQGERQLITIARAIISNPSMLILDEATSSVDTSTEKEIQRALDKLMKGRTSLLIAHRLSTIRDSEMILVIDSGRIIEKGSHEELMELKGLYYKMVVSQMMNVEKY